MRWSQLDWCSDGLTGGNERFEEVLQLCGNCVPTSATVRGDGCCVPGGVEDRANSLGERRWFSRGHEASAGVAHDLGNAASICGHDGTAACQSLQDDVGAAFHITWQRD